MKVSRMVQLIFTSYFNVLNLSIKFGGVTTPASLNLFDGDGMGCITNNEI